ncbi:MAG: FHA domain-containing protein [Chloroflexota bacterium]
MSTNSGMIVVIKGPSTGLEVRLTEQETVIGRDERADLVFNSSAVSRRHARIILRNGQYAIQDLGSSNGTFVNGQRIEQSTVLKDGDEIGLGQAIVMRFSAIAGDGASGEGEPSSEDARTMMQATVYSVDEDVPATVGMDKTKIGDAQQPADAPRLIVQVAGQSPQAHELHDEVITLGRAEDNDVVLPSRIVSRYHARLEKSGDTYRLVVLPQASNAVLFQGEALQEPRLLRHGDELRIGQDDSPFQVTLTFGSPQAAAAGATAAQPAARKPAATQLQQAVSAPAGGQRESRATKRPRFAVQIAGNPQQTFTLDRERITIGRAEDNDIILPSPIVSRHHAYLERSNGGYRLVPLRDITNPLLYEGRPLSEPQRMRHEDKFRIGGLDPGAMVTMTYLSPAEARDTTEARTVDFSEKTTLTLGRDDSNDIVVDNPIVSRYHAQIERVGQRYRVRDLRSSNGTFVNDERIEGEVWLQPDDTVRIGPYRFVVGQEALAQYDDSGGLHVEAVGLNKWVREDLNILQNISMVFQPREFIVVVGQSGGGKSTLIDAVAGYRPATHGTVHVNDIDVYQNFDAVRNDIGYVPQRDIIHMELTVFQALDYSAQLRMPPDVTEEERHARIMEVLEDLDLAHRKDTQISELSGGQQKRVSIGVELLTKPGLFFLDEPTSGLDPGTETSLMQLMRRLADQGRTIVLITHATKNVMLADKVVFLARGGHLVWYGPPDEALAYFDKYRSERDRRARDIEFDEIYAILEDSRNGTPEEWAERFRNHAAHEKYIARPLEEVEIYPSGNGQAAASAAAQPVAGRQKQQISSLRQFSILSSRNIKILTRDKFSLALMLAAAPLVALLQVVLAAVVGANPFDFTEGNFALVLIILFLPTVYAVMVGGLAQMREIVKEQEVYKRERLVNLRILPYVMSKIWVAALLALYQTACYILVHYLAFDMPGGVTEMLVMYFSLLLATMAGMMLGLFSSALAPNPNSAPLIVILLMVPQIVLGGALVPLPGAVTAPISTRWAFEAFMTITGAGSDVARDNCWDLPPEQRSELTLEQKDANCNCMGTNALDVNSCSFPGVGQFYTAALDQPAPQEPGEPPAEPGAPPPEPGDPPERLGPQPEEPELPPQPERPEDEADQVAMANYFDDLEAWQEEVETIQSGYRAELDDYQAQAQIAEAELEAYQEQVNSYQEALREYQATVDDYQARLADYQESVFDYQTERATWEGERLSAVVPAESMIRQFDQDFGWTFVNKNDSSAYWGRLVVTWVAQSIIIGVLFAGILVLQKRKDLA